MGTTTSKHTTKDLAGSASFVKNDKQNTRVSTTESWKALPRTPDEWLTRDRLMTVVRAVTNGRHPGIFVIGDDGNQRFLNGNQYYRAPKILVDGRAVILREKDAKPGDDEDDVVKVVAVQYNKNAKISSVKVKSRDNKGSWWEEDLKDLGIVRPRRESKVDVS